MEKPCGKGVEGDCMIHINVSELYLSSEETLFPELQQIPAMQRRRLSTIAKLALNSALSALKETSVDYIVWVSQYGDEHKTFKILADVLQDQTPSPTQFSTSVHNAVSGLYSILCQDATPATSLAGTWNDALIEAYSWLKTTTIQDAKVLIVFYEESMPNIYMESHPFDAFAISGVISLKNENLACSMGTQNTVKNYYEDVLAFYHFWESTSDVQLKGWKKI